MACEGHVVYRVEPVRLVKLDRRGYLDEMVHRERPVLQGNLEFLDCQETKDLQEKTEQMASMASLGHREVRDLLVIPAGADPRDKPAHLGLMGCVVMLVKLVSQVILGHRVKVAPLVNQGPKAPRVSEVTSECLVQLVLLEGMVPPDHQGQPDPQVLRGPQECIRCTCRPWAQELKARVCLLMIHW